jgi:hypothetical protein
MINWILVLVWRVIHLLLTVVCKEGRGSNGALRMAYGAETLDTAFFTDTEDSTGAGIFSDPAATPTRDGVQ